MSYDCSIRGATTCPHCNGKLSEEDTELEEIGNMTSNVSGMWDAATKFAGGVCLRDWAYDKSQRCSEIQPILDMALAYLEDPANEEKLRAMEPSNGWGSYEGAVSYFRKIVGACRRHPAGFLHISN